MAVSSRTPILNYDLCDWPIAAGRHITAKLGRPSASMLRIQFPKFALTSLLIVVSACASEPIVPVELCYESDRFAELDETLLGAGLSQSGRWSAKHYGRDCYVCAEPYSIDENTFSFHLTSPFDDIMVDTSAVLTFSRTDASIVREAKYHSCHVWVSKDGEES